MKRLLRNFTSSYLDIIACFSSLVFTIGAILVSLNRFWQYEIFYYDFGIFDRAIWQVSRFKPPVVEHLVVSGKWIFADHFNPSIFILVPFYWITQRSEILLIVQSVAVGLAGFIIYLIGKELIDDKFLALSIALCFFLFAGVQNAVITDFHEVTLSILPLSLAFLFILKKKIRSYFVSLIILLGFKESIFLVGAGIGFAIFFIQKEWFKVGFLTIVLSIIWGLLSIKIIIPYFSGGLYQYSPSFVSSPFSLITSLVDESTKTRTIFYSFFSFGFLSFLSPAFWLLFFQDLLSRFYSPLWPTRWGLGLHYSVQLAVLLAISSLYSLNSFRKNKIFKKYCYLIGFFLILNALILHRFILRGPLTMSYNPDFYKNTDNFKFLDKLVDKVPSNASVATQNNLAVRFSHQTVFLLRENYKSNNPDYILIDNRYGQNPNNFFGAKNKNKLIESIKKDKNYSIIYETKEQYLFKNRHLY